MQAARGRKRNRDTVRTDPKGRREHIVLDCIACRGEGRPGVRFCDPPHVEPGGLSGPADG
jgi:hypothetical protein